MSDETLEPPLPPIDALILRRRANIEHISLGEQRIDTAARDAR